MDECHQLIKDVDYRTDIVLPMNDFFRFKSKALVSATPIGFSDPRFKEFETVEVSADYDYRQEIAVTHTYNIYKAISEYLGNHTEETVCFFRQFRGNDLLHNETVRHIGGFYRLLCAKKPFETEK